MIFADTANVTTVISYSVGIIVIIVASIVTWRSSKYSQASHEYKDLADAQDKRIKFLEDTQTEYKKKIDYLEGQVNVLKDLPLKKLADDQEKFITTLQEITETMKTMQNTMIDNAKHVASSAAKQVIQYIDRQQVKEQVVNKTINP
jgi:hypothetical protein